MRGPGDSWNLQDLRDLKLLIRTVIDAFSDPCGLRAVIIRGSDHCGQQTLYDDQGMDRGGTCKGKGRADEAREDREVAGK